MVHTRSGTKRALSSPERVNKDTQPTAKKTRQEHTPQGLLLGLNAELQSIVLQQCDATSLGHLEQVNRHFAPPPQSLVQQAVRGLATVVVRWLGGAQQASTRRRKISPGRQKRLCRAG